MMPPGDSHRGLAGPPPPREAQGPRFACVSIQPQDVAAVTPPAASVPEGSGPSHMRAVVAPAPAAPRWMVLSRDPLQGTPQVCPAPSWCSWSCIPHLPVSRAGRVQGGALENAEKRDQAGLAWVQGPRHGLKGAYRTGALDPSAHGSYQKGQVEAEAWE